MRILGTPADSIDAAEDRERFDALLEQLSIKRPLGKTVKTEDRITSYNVCYTKLLRIAMMTIALYALTAVEETFIA